MAEKYSTIQQHQPLRTPNGWDKQEKALVVQLDEIFDDIYRRFGRLTMSDFSKEMQYQFADIEGNFAEIRADVNGLDIRVGTIEGEMAEFIVDAERIWAAVNNKYDEQSSIEILSAGIEISGGKYLLLKNSSNNDFIKMDRDSFRIVNSGSNIIQMDTSGMKLASSGSIVLQSGQNNLISIGGTGIGIQSGGTFTVHSGQFSIDTSGNAKFGGEITANAVVACNISASKITSGTLDCSNLTVTNLNASAITTGTLDCANLTVTNLSAGAIKGGTMKLGGTYSNGSIEMYNSGGTKIGIWDSSGLSAQGTVETANWKFSNEGAIYTIGSFKMAFGPFSNQASVTNGGVFFRELPSGSGLGQIVLVARDSYGLYEGQAVLSCDSGSTGSFWPTSNTSNPHTVSLGNYTHPWINSWQTNICAPAQLRLYPNVNTVPPTSGTSIAYGSMVFTTITSNNKNYVMMLPGGAANGEYEYQVGKSDFRMDWGFFHNITSTNNLVVDSSIAYKHDVREIKDDGEKIDRLRPVSYIHNRDKKNRRQFGLIWEEAVKVFPEICSEEKDHRGIMYDGLIPVLLKEIQSLRARVATLEGGN